MTLYQGYGGSIEIDGPMLIIIRSGLAAKANNLPTGPRHIPIAAVSAVDFREATRLRNGHIRLALGGEPISAIAATQTAADPNAVIFTHRQNAAFAELNNLLQRAVDDNRATGVDAAAAYAQADDPLLAMGPSRKAARKAKADALQDRANALKEQLGTAGEREDIATAAARLHWTMGSKREIKKLPEHLGDGESVKFLAAGKYDDAMGLVALTDRRVLFLRHGFTGSQLVDFPLHVITSVQSTSSLGLGKLRIFASGNTTDITQIAMMDLQPLAEAIRAAIAVSSASTERTEAAPQPRPGVLGQLEQLAELHRVGVLTDEEFAAKKQVLLDRL
ncbi:DUF4429 domain-containing protein [Streptomyces sp. NPDC002144]